MTFGVAYGLAILVFCVPIMIVGKNNYRIILFLNKLCCSILALLSYPKSGFFVDAQRFDYIHDISHALIAGGHSLQGFRWIFQYSQYAGNYILDIYLWLFSFLSDAGWLRFFTVFIFLTLIEKIILNTSSEDTSIKTNYLVFLIFEVMFNLYFEIEGIRNFLAFALFIFVLVELFWKPKASKIRLVFFAMLVIFAIGFHSATFLLLAIVPTVFVANKYLRIFFIAFFLNVNQIVPGILSLVADKSGGYIGSQASWALHYFAFSDEFQTFASSKEIIFTTIMFIGLFGFISPFLIRNTFGPNSYRWYVIYLGCFIIGMRTNTQIYLRLIQAFLFVSLPYFNRIFMSTSKTNVIRFKNQSNIVQLFLRISLVAMAILMYYIWYRMLYDSVLIV